MIRIAILLGAVSASMLGAQANIPQMRGDVGLKAGSQAPPGLFTTLLYNTYESQRVVTSEGAEVVILRPNTNTSALRAIYSSKAKVLGGRWSAMVALPWVDVGLAAPTLDSRSSWGFSDMYVVPVQLGWTFSRADLIVGQGMFIPTGRFHNDALDNTGLGMWSWESTLGGTFYLSPSKQLNVSTLASYQVQGRVRGTDKRAGNVLTLEGGIGQAITKRYGQAGVAYYARWKLTDDVNYQLTAPFDARDRTFAIGPELTTPVLDKFFLSSVTLRYFFEEGNRVATEGNSFWVFATAYFPKAAAR